MSDFNNQFITTVAQCFLRDTDLDAIVMKSKTLLNSNIAFNVDETEIRGGEFHKLLYTYNYGRTGEITLEDAEYKPEIVAINCGQTVQNQLTDVYIFEESVILDENGDGSVTLQTPSPNATAYVQVDNRTIITKNFSGSNFSMGGAYANKQVYVTYKYNDTIDMVTIDGANFSKSYELVMEVKVFDKNGLKEKIQWIFPAFKPSGNFEMPLGSDTPSTSTMNGKVMDVNDVYGYKKVIPVAGTGVSYSAIVADTGLVELESGEDYMLTVLGMRGGMYAPVKLNNSDLTFDSSDADVATVNNTGLIEYAGVGTTYITITHDSGFIDTVQVDCA